MNYNDAIIYLENCHKLGSKRGFENFKNLLALLGNPHNNLKCIHVAGTNGKGSTCVMLSYILKESGFNVGLFTSPHLCVYNERIKINDIYISNDDFADIITFISKKVNELFKNNKEYFSFFEIITAAAFLYFYKNNVDFAIMETGLGGRLDATNVIEKPIVSVITSISYDHMEYLGNSIEQIALEKGGIIKKNCPVVLYCQGKRVYNVIKDIAESKNASLFYVDDYNIEILKQDLNETIFNIENELVSYKNVKIKMVGDYQIKNACNVLITCKLLEKYGITKADVISGIFKAYFHGRMEVISKKPFIIIDGAHNIEAAIEFRKFLFKFKSNHNNIIVIVGILKDKDYKNIVNIIVDFADIVIVTEPNNKRALTAHELYNCIKKENKTVFMEADYRKAFNLAYQKAKNGFLFCTGSLYLIGEIRNYFFTNIKININ